jgi:hypothetical protein
VHGRVGLPVLHLDLCVCVCARASTLVCVPRDVRACCVHDCR